jgi:hypothetical protein
MKAHYNQTIKVITPFGIRERTLRSALGRGGGNDEPAARRFAALLRRRSGAIETKDLERVAADTTVQKKAVAHPTDARLTHRAIEKLVDLAEREGVELRQS